MDCLAGPCRNVWGGGVGYSLLERDTGRVVARHNPPVSSDWTVAGGSSGGSAVAVAR